MRVHRVDGFSPEALAEQPARAAGRPAPASASSPSTTRWCARRSARRPPPGTPVLTLVSDIAHAPRIAYVGIDNRNAGRLAGHLLGRFVPGSAGEVALFAGSLSYRGHEEREMGFRHILADEFPKLADRRAARGPRRSRAQLPRGQPPARRHAPSCAGSTISAPATAASPGRWRKRGGAARSCSSATS